MTTLANRKGIENLANAIIRQAVHDYRRAASILKKNPDNKKAQEAKEEITMFFRSPWCEILTKLNGEWILEQLQEEVA